MGQTFDIAGAARAAIEAAGGGAKLAGRLGITRYAVQQWKANGIPPRRVGKVAALTGIEPKLLRPDLWEPPAPLPTRTPAQADAA